MSEPPSQCEVNDSQTLTCGWRTWFMGPCVLDQGHGSWHEDEDGTEFSHSGKLGVGKIGPNFRAAIERSKP